MTSKQLTKYFKNTIKLLYPYLKSQRQEMNVQLIHNCWENSHVIKVENQHYHVDLYIFSINNDEYKLYITIYNLSDIIVLKQKCVSGMILHLDGKILNLTDQKYHNRDIDFWQKHLQLIETEALRLKLLYS